MRGLDFIVPGVVVLLLVRMKTGEERRRIITKSSSFTTRPYHISCHHAIRTITQLSLGFGLWQQEEEEQQPMAMQAARP